MLSRIDIVIETVLNSRTNAELHTGIKLLQCLCKKMGRRMPKRMLTLFGIPLEKALCLHPQQSDGIYPNPAR